jgi:hypothetical protein
MPAAGQRGSLMLVDPGGRATQLERSELYFRGQHLYDEAWLQQLVAQHPDCLPIKELEPGLGPFSSVCTELPTAHGYIDNLLMTPGGDIAVVETKLFRNPEATRKVLAQVIDYAGCLFQMTYEQFEQAVIVARRTSNLVTTSLYDLLPEADKASEHVFHDVVSENLRRGRVLILIVGDGIQSNLHSLLGNIRGHAWSSFTLALVELAIFHLPNSPGHLIIRAGTLAKTAIVERTVVETTANGTIIKAAQQRLPVPETLSSERFWAALEEQVTGARASFERLISAASEIGVYPEFLKSLNLKWDQPGGKAVNLGYIFKYTSIWTDMAANSVPRDLAHAYVEDLAKIWECQCHVLPTSGNWTLYKDGKPLRLREVLGRLSDWLGPMQRFIAAIQERSTDL